MNLPLPDLMAGVILASLVIYVLLGGADFGGGVWDLAARGPRAARHREAVAHAIGPIWEANHVWMIIAVVLLFTCFPPAFSVIMTALHVPVTLPSQETSSVNFPLEVRRTVCAPRATSRPSTSR